MMDERKEGEREEFYEQCLTNTKGNGRIEGIGERNARKGVKHECGDGVNGLEVNMLHCIDIKKKKECVSGVYGCIGTIVVGGRMT